MLYHLAPLIDAVVSQRSMTFDDTTTDSVRHVVQDGEFLREMRLNELFERAAELRDGYFASNLFGKTRSGTESPSDEDINRIHDLAVDFRLGGEKSDVTDLVLTASVRTTRPIDVKQFGER